MRLIPTLAELKQRWIRQPYTWLKIAFVGGTRLVATIIRAYCRGYAVSPPLVSGATAGLIVPLLGLLYLHLGGGEWLFIYGHSGGPATLCETAAVHAERLLCVPFAATMCLCWMSNVLFCGNWATAFLLLFSMAASALLFWIVAVLKRRIVPLGRMGIVCGGGAILLLLGTYLCTWRIAVADVRMHIANDCARQQNWGHKNYPEKVPAAPMDPGIFYCFPVLPGVVASEHCFLYGPLMGGGSQDLRLWKGREVRRVFTFSFWSH